MTRAEKWSVGISLAAFLFSGITGYFQFFQGPNTTLHFGPRAYFLGPEIIGIQCLFVNAGSTQDIITFVTADVEKTQIFLEALWRSVGAHEWRLREGLRQEYTSEPKLTDFTPITIPPGGRESDILWFGVNSNSDFRFEAKDYQLRVRAFGSSMQDQRVSGVVEISISGDELKRMRTTPHLEVVVRERKWIR